MASTSIEDFTAAVHALAARSRVGTERISVTDMNRNGPTPIAQSADCAQRYASLEMGSEPAEVSGARHWAEFIADCWGLAAIRNSVATVVSELLANAIKAGAAATSTPRVIQVQLLLDSESLCIAVRDECPHAHPRIGQGQDGGEHGRGLHMVDVLCETWGWYAAKHAKVVWGELSIAPSASTLQAAPD
jgi:anti-sigma regulatory factor (Ser/Thr protein kinase)